MTIAVGSKRENRRRTDDIADQLPFASESVVRAGVFADCAELPSEHGRGNVAWNGDRSSHSGQTSHIFYANGTHQYVNPEPSKTRDGMTSDDRTDLTELERGSELVKQGFARMQKGGVIMDVVNREQARIAEDADGHDDWLADKIEIESRRSTFRRAPS